MRSAYEHDLPKSCEGPSMLQFIQRVFSPSATNPVDPGRQFEEEYPLSLAGRLEYLEERLNLQRATLLNLAGAPASFASDPAVQGQPWEDLLCQQTPDHVEQLAAIEAAIVDYLAEVGYDMSAAAATLAEMA